MSKNIGCRIVTGYKRPSAALVKRFENMPVAKFDASIKTTGYPPYE